MNSGSTLGEQTFRTSSLGLVMGKTAQMASGFLFWIAAAQFATIRDFGLTATMVSAVMLCALVGSLGVGAAVIRAFHGLGEEVHATLDSGTALVGVASLLAAAALLGATSLVFAELHAVVRQPALVALFLVMSVLGAVNVLLDQVSMAMRRGHQVLGRNMAGAAVMIGTLLSLVLTYDPPLSVTMLFVCWVAGGVSATLLGAWQLRRAIGYRFRGRVRPSVCRNLLRGGLPNWALTLTERAPALVLPLFITELLSPTVTALWYPVWMMAWAVFVVPTSVGIALFAEASRGPREARSAIWRSLRWSLQLGGAAAVALAVLAYPVLSLLGEQFADSGTTALRILLLGLLPLAVSQTYFSLGRAADRMVEVVVVGAVTAVVTVVATVTAGLAHGLDGMAVAWVAVQAVVGAWSLLRLLRGRWVSDHLTATA